MAGTVTRSLFDLPIIRQAVIDSFRKLTPQRQVRNPVMFVVYVGSILTTLLWAQAVVGKGEAPAWFIFWVSMWLWFTVLFANFAEAMAEGRGKAQAASLRKARRDSGAVGLAHRRGDRQPGRGVPRPHDIPRRGRQAPEDAERDRARHPPGRNDDHLPPRHRDAAAVLVL